MPKFRIFLISFHFILLTAVPSLAYAEFGRVLKFDLMEECVGNPRPDTRKIQIQICGCALDKTEAKGFLSKYNDGDYRNDEANFRETFDKSVEYYIKNYSDCS